MDIDRIEALVDLVAKSGVSEVTVRSTGGRITVRKQPAAARPQRQPRADGVMVVAVPAGATEQAAVAAAPADTHFTVTAPMVGIFYHAEPPVGPGTVVRPGQVVGAIESMKLMNDVRAEVGGGVAEILVEAGMAVEYGQPLFVVAETAE